MALATASGYADAPELTDGVPAPAPVLFDASVGMSESQAPVPEVPVDDSAPGVCLRFRFGKCRNKRCRYLHDEAFRPTPPPAAIPRSVASAAGWTDAVEDKQADVPKKGTESGHTAWRSVDWLLNGQSVQTQPYLKHFAQASWLPELLGREGCKSLFNKRGRCLRKEITEAVGVLNAAMRALAKLDFPGHDGGGAAVLDACCGKGLGSLVLAQTWKDSVVHAVDCDPRMDLSHFQEQPNIRFHQLDLHSATAAAVAADAAREAAARGAPVVLVGTHLCGALSPRLVDIFLGLEGPAALVLSPCCLDRNRPAIKRKAKRLAFDPHMYWCLSLLWSLPSSAGHRRELLIDDNVMSERNTFILATKTS